MDRQYREQAAQAMQDVARPGSVHGTERSLKSGKNCIEEVD